MRLCGCCVTVVFYGYTPQPSLLLMGSVCPVSCPPPLSSPSPQPFYQPLSSVAVLQVTKVISDAFGGMLR